MQNSNIKTSQHAWENKNLVTITGRGGHYDEVVCANCGMKGKRYDFENVKVAETYKVEKVHYCPKVVVPQKIRIIRCNAHGEAFLNLTPDSIHDIIPTPKGEKKAKYGVWVMGVGEPVVILHNEYSKEN